AESIRPSLRNGFTAYVALSPVRRALLPPSSARGLLLTNLAPASGARTTRFCRTLQTPLVTTAHPQYALRGYEFSISSFLVKPIELEQFQAAIEKVKQQVALTSQTQQLTEKESERFFLKIDREIVGFGTRQVRYIKAMHNYVKLYHEKNYSVHRSPLYKLLDQLPMNKFIQISRQIIVQIDCIERVGGNNVYLYTGEHFEIGVPYRKQLFATLTSIGRYDTVL
ncbi:MAG: LytTR family DNA-binding domain-containing protein, partial [Rudanella sp.]|nr:LytTR family DNA-binding domain-containing protein [Rudanella sp.]